MCRDISTEWPGLTVKILGDIFGIHKALVFGRLQRSDYSVNEFMNNIKKAGNNVFKEDICTRHVSKEVSRLKLSFYPDYLINDDLFEVMAYHYAVSSVVRSMLHEMNNVNEFNISSVVLPVAISSRYDVDVRYHPSITNVLQLIKVKPPKHNISRTFQSNLKDVAKMAKQINDMIKMCKLSDDGVISKYTVIVFDRHETTDANANTINVLGFDDQKGLEVLRQNYFLSFDFCISRNQVISSHDKDTVVRCWMNFGVGQRLRFYPEYATWIVPQLFVRSTTMTAHKFLERVYGEHYKHGWRVSLDDPVFNRYYHIITEHEHVSNNYNRDEVKVKQQDVQRLLRDHLDRELKYETAVTLKKYIEKHRYDSETILEDMEDTEDSNIASFDGLKGSEFRNIKFAVLKFQNMECKTDSVRDLDDCEHIHILIENLRKFQECGLVVDAVNVVEFDVNAVITAFDHIVKVHNFVSDAEAKLKIQYFVADRIACSEGAECGILKEHSERTRERGNIEEKTTDPVHEVDTLCEVTADALSSAHCYILHHDAHLYRLISGRENAFASRFSTAVDDDQKGDDEEVKEDGTDQTFQSQGINFGLNVLRWLPFGQKPQFETLGEEMIRNPNSTIDAHIFQQYLMICIAKINDTNFTVNEMVCLKLYTDTNEMQSQLRKAHWTAALLKTRKAYYQWAMGLYRAHLYHDAPIPTASDTSSKPCRLYHGLNRLFTVSREMPMYFGPFSTTIARTVASTFCNEQGLIWLIQSSYANPLKLVVGIKVDWISGFKHEREVLLYNQCLPIQETETFDDNSDVLMNHFINSLISRESPIIKKDAFYKQLGVGLDANWLNSIHDHDSVFAKTECNGMRVIDRLVKELGVVGPNMAVKLWTTKHDDKSELEYVVEDLKVVQLQDHYRVMTSKFKLLHFSPFLNRTWLRFTGNDKEDCFQGTTYKTNGQSIDMTTCYVKGQVTKIQVKNIKFFGNRLLNLQTFHQEREHKDLSDDFIDALKVDRYGFVFVDDVPKRDHQFSIGDAVKCYDDSCGKICNTTVDRVCVQIGDEKRWIERNVIPMEVILLFPNQQHVGKCVFVLSEDVVDDVSKLSEAKQYSFSDIKDFEIPYSVMKNSNSDVVSFEIYAKPKGIDVPFIKIKSFEYWTVALHVNAVEQPVGAISKLDTRSGVDQLMMILKEMDSEIKDDAAFVKSTGLQLNQNDSELMECIGDHSMLFDVTSYRRKLVIERLIVELNLLSPEWVRSISKQTKNDKPLLDWLVEERKIPKLLDHYQAMKSKFKILHYSPLLNRSWLRLQKNNNMKDLGDAINDDDSKETQYRVNGETFATTTLSVKGKVTRVEVKNVRLFGSRFANLQNFGDEEDQKEADSAASPFIDALSVDHYGFVFVDDVPKRDHQFLIGDMVRYKDESTGKICELTADSVCIKIGNERQCIKRSVIPTAVTLTIPHQSDIGNYEFVLNSEAHDYAPNLSEAEQYSFSDMKRFEIPYPLIRNRQSEVVSFGVYLKPKNIDVPLIKIKTIEYTPNDVNEAVISNSESAVNHLVGTLKQTRTVINDEVAFLNLFSLHRDDQSKWMHLIIDHSMLFEVTSYRKKLVIERLIVELNLFSNEWLHAILKQKKQNKPLLDWLVEDRKLFRLLDCYRVLSPKFKIEKYSKLLNCSWLSVVKNTKMGKEFGIKEDHDVPYLVKAEHRIDGTLVPFSTLSLDGYPQAVTVTNSELFGDEVFTLQKFDAMNNERAETQMRFCDTLTIDDSVVNSASIGIQRRVKVKENGNWISGVVSRVTADKVCVMIGDGDSFSFQWVEREHIFTKIKTIPFENENEISEFDFAARAGSKNDRDNLSNLREIAFGNIKDFRIPTDLLTATSTKVDTVHIYAKPKQKDLRFHHIKALDYKIGFLSFSRYFVDQKEPFCIDKVVAVKPYSKELQCGGKFEVVTTSKILISQSGGANAAECGLKYNWKQPNGSMLKYGEYIDAVNGNGGVDSVSKEQCVGGGIICLIAGGDVVNEGTLISRGSSGGLFSGGTILISTDGLFVNNGVIDGGHRSAIDIHCARFVNDGQISSTPNVVIYGSKSGYVWFRYLYFNGKEQLIKLSVDSHRGHVYNNHIKNVLEEGTSRYYHCRNNGSANEDWFVFKIQEKKRFIPKRVVIRNYGNSADLKKISIAGKSDDDGDTFTQWMQINDIRKGGSKLQSFLVDEMSGYFAWERGFTLFRVNVVENYGSSSQNLFYEFRIYGVYDE